jgi:hypothetical protein
MTNLVSTAVGPRARVGAARVVNGTNAVFQIACNCDLYPVPRSMGPKHASRARMGARVNNAVDIRQRLARARDEERVVNAEVRPTRFELVINLNAHLS